MRREGGRVDMFGSKVFRFANPRFKQVISCGLAIGIGASGAKCSPPEVSSGATHSLSRANRQSIVAKSRPGEDYVRIDSILDDAPPDMLKNNAFHGTLRGDDMIEAYEIYAHRDTGDIICLVAFGNALNGHAGIVHGGITALAFDNSFGWVFLAKKLDPAFTANLNINYRLRRKKTEEFIERLMSFDLGEKLKLDQLLFLKQKSLKQLVESCLWRVLWRT
jgi:hypothetical protein